MFRHPSANSSQRRAQDISRLPKGFSTIRDLLDGNVYKGRSASTVGVVKDYRLPIPTRGSDHKSIVTLYDASTEWDNQGIDLNIFRKEADMPEFEAGDIVLVSMAKVQNRNGSYSLLTEWRTEIHVWDARQMDECRRRGSLRDALRKSKSQTQREPDANWHEYAFGMFQGIDKSLVPDQEQFVESKVQSLNIKDKFSLLEGVGDGKFSDLLVQVVKEPWDHMDCMTLWVSDYTENSSFFHKTSDSTHESHGMPIRDGDEFGYTNGRKKPLAHMDDGPEGWDGPMGKKSLQLSCWNPHADFVRSHIHKGDWVRLRNVQIRFGHNSVNLEGFLREDRKYADRVYVEVLDVHGDRETIDPRLIDALRRKRDYEKEQEQSHRTGEKRKVEDPPKKGARTKRQKRREHKQKALEKAQAVKEAALGMNEIVISEHEDQAIVPLSTILKPVLYTTTIADQEVKLELPFTCATYRTCVRVVDFHPAALEDFAVGRTATEYDILSDNEDSEPDSDSSQPPAHPGYSQANKRRIWDWRFALKLEEVSTSPKNKTLAQTWAVVDNFDAQLLLDLDAVDLHAPENAGAVNTLRERLFKLWGNLEERKIRLETMRKQHVKDPLRAPPPDSSDDEGDVARRVADDAAEDVVSGNQLSNRPFICCIRQYGVKVKAEEDEVATAGDGKTWQRIFGLFGTKIKDD